MSAEISRQALIRYVALAYLEPATYTVRDSDLGPVGESAMER